MAVEKKAAGKMTGKKTKKKMADGKKSLKEKWAMKGRL